MGKAKTQDVKEVTTEDAPVNDLTGFPDAMAATGDIVAVPETPQEIAEQATALGNSGDHATGGDAGAAPAVDEFGNAKPKEGKRLWALDNDVTERNRGGFDTFKPDASVMEA